MNEHKYDDDDASQQQAGISHYIFIFHMYTGNLLNLLNL